MPVSCDCLFAFETVFVSGGVPGLDLEIDPLALSELVISDTATFSISGS